MWERIFRKSRKEEKIEEEEKIVIKKPDRSWAKHAPEGSLLFVHLEDEPEPNNPKIFWFKVEEINKTPDGKVTLIGSIHGPQNAEKIRISGETRVQLVE